MDSIIAKEKKCYICEMTEPYVKLDPHHCINGNGLRELADEDGLWVWLCRKHHSEAHADGCLMNQYRRLGQIYYEKTHTRKEFVSRYGKSYIQEDKNELV